MKPIWFVSALFVLVLVLRLIIAFSQPLHYDAYDSLRNARSVIDSGVPLFHDDLSYQGRTRAFTPVWAYFLGGFGLLMPLETAARILPNLLMAASVFLVYGIVRRLTSSSGAGLFSSLCVGFLPISFIVTATTASATALTIFLMLLTSFFVVNIHRKSFTWYALFSGLLMVASSPISLVVVAGFIVYALISRLEDAEARRAIEEIILVWLAFGLWYYLLLFKQAFHLKGFAVLWDMPVSLLSQWFGNVTFVQVLLSIGFVSVVLGAFGAYHTLFERKQPLTLLFVGLLLALVPAILFKLIRGQVGLVFLGVILAILAGVSAHAGYVYLGRTKIAWAGAISVAIVLLIFSVSVVAGMSFYENDAPSPADKLAIEYLSSVSKNSTIVSRPLEASYIMYLASRKTLIDSDFLIAPDASARLNVVQSVFTSPFGLPVMRSLDDFGVEYVFLSEGTQFAYGISALPSEGECFELVYNEKARIYRKTCGLA